jgi:Ca2+-binding EF-hand superfamily protein
MAAHWQQYNFRRTKVAGTLSDDVLQQVFAEIDTDASGYIEGAELSAAVARWSQSTGQMGPSPKAMLAFADVDGDGKISMSEFIKVMRHEPPKDLGRTAAPAAPVGASEQPGLEDAFEQFCSFGSKSRLTELDNAKFAKLCRDAKLLDKRFTKVDVDMAFAKVTPKGKRKLTFAEFERALELVAAKKGCSVEEVQAAVAAAAPSSSGTKAEVSGIVSKMTDTSQYTGAHKERFDAEGHGKGLAGRDYVPKGQGHVPARPFGAA